MRAPPKTVFFPASACNCSTFWLAWSRSFCVPSRSDLVLKPQISRATATTASPRLTHSHGPRLEAAGAGAWPGGGVGSVIIGSDAKAGAPAAHHPDRVKARVTGV